MEGHQDSKAAPLKSHDHNCAMNGAAIELSRRLAHTAGGKKLLAGKPSGVV